MLLATFLKDVVLDPNNQTLLDEAEAKRKRANFLMDPELAFYQQKAKCDFIMNSERCTSYFHSIFKKNRKKNAVGFLVREDGSKTTSIGEVANIFVDYYTTLFGTSSRVEPVDPDILAAGSSVPISAHSALLATVTPEEGLFNFHKDCASLGITHLAFADDLMLFSRGDLQSVQVFMDALDHFSRLSRLILNPTKSNIFLAGKYRDNSHDLLALASFPRAEKESLWVKWVHNIYIRDEDIWNWQPKKRHSVFLKRLAYVRDLLAQKLAVCNPNLAVAMQPFCSAGNLISGKVYELFRAKANHKPWMAFIWQSFIPPKCSFTMWLALRRRLPTKTNLDFLGLPIECTFCGNELEDVDHLIFSCEVFKDVWRAVKTWLRMEGQLSTLNRAIRSLKAFRRGDVILKKARRIALACTVFHLWKLCNAVHFDQEPLRVDAVVFKIKIGLLHSKASLSILNSSCVVQDLGVNELPTMAKSKKKERRPPPPTPPNKKELRTFLRDLEGESRAGGDNVDCAENVDNFPVMTEEDFLPCTKPGEVTVEDDDGSDSQTPSLEEERIEQELQKDRPGNGDTPVPNAEPTEPIEKEDSGKEIGNNDGNVPGNKVDTLVEKKSFASLFEKNMSEDKGMKLHQVEMTEEEEVFIQPEDITPMEELWGPCVVGCFTGRFPGLAPIQTLVEFWKVPSQFLPHHKGWVVFKFLNNEDRDSVLHRDDHRINNKKLLLNIPQDGFMWNAKSFSTMPFWVKLMDVPMQFWGSNSLSKIASKLGSPLFTDGLTNKVASKLTVEKDPEDKLAYKKPNFCRVLIHMDLSKPPPSCVKVNYMLEAAIHNLWSMRISPSTAITKTFHITFVFALYNVSVRRNLSDKLSDIAGRINTPSAIMGDFNAVLDSSERINCHTYAYDMTDLLQFRINNDLLDAKATGLGYQAPGTRQLRLCRKLKLLKHPLKQLNKKEFGHISTRAENARSTYSELMTRLMTDPHNSALIEQAASLRKKATFYSDAERSFFLQKVKCTFINEGDKCTKFFHATMKKQKVLSSIPFIITSQGSTTTSSETIVEDFIDHYSNIFDDVMMFCRGNKDFVTVLANTIQNFSQVSGLYVSPLKSNIFLAGEIKDSKSDLLSLVSFPEGKLPVRYLGLPLTSQRDSERDFAPLIAKVDENIRKWNTKSLSSAGSLELIRSVIQGIEGFWFQAFPIHKSVLDRITTLCRAFLWGCKFCKVAWDDICKPKEEGGLGLRNSTIWNRALLAKCFWNIAANKETLWIQWVHSIYLQGSDFWT
ncbi:unnamed protein product [Cuscuta campestris]|uniref:Reverse transcriptase zinc-binding domain-containing protein n=1 Tax=Cuscuta campestris TaxID=132261 RepID=A0A484M301_9ASTE|nr:unnamed protein product [Cuscuta campestris]